MIWDDLKKAELGQSYNVQELTCCCHAIYGGIAWPSKRAGFAIIVAMNFVLPPERREICLLDEYESFSVRDLVRQCGVLDLKYAPKQWIGDWQFGPAERFIAEINSNLEKRGRRPFSPVEPFELLEMKPLYPYILDEIKRLLDRDHRQLFLPDDSKILNYLRIEPDEVAELEFGAFPAIEALAFAVIEMQQWERDIRLQEPKHSPWDNNVLTRGFKIRGKGA